MWILISFVHFIIYFVSSILDLRHCKSAGMSRWLDTIVSSCGLNPTGSDKSPLPLIFRQLFECESNTYTYLLADPITKDAILIDPVVETADR